MQWHNNQPIEALDLNLLQLTQSIEDILYNLELLQGYIAPVLRADGVEKGFLRTDQGYAQLSSFVQGFDIVPTVEQSPSPTFEYTLKVGENLLTVATDLLNSPSDWIKLAKLNSCLDAHTKGNGSILQAGDIILVPTDEVAPTIAPKIFIDLSLVDGDLSIQGDDLALVTGTPAVQQSIIYRLLTEKGQLTLFPSFGLQRVIGAQHEDRINTYIIVDIREQLLIDTRVIDILSIDLVADGDGVAIDLTVRTSLSSDTISIVAPI